MEEKKIDVAEENKRLEGKFLDALLVMALEQLIMISIMITMLVVRQSTPSMLVLSLACGAFLGLEYSWLKEARKRAVRMAGLFIQLRNERNAAEEKLGKLTMLALADKTGWGRA